MTDYTKLIERLRDAGSDVSLTNEGDMLAKQPEILAEYTGINGARQWASVGAWLYEGDAIAVISDHFRDATKMVQPLGWYCVSRDGIATQCANQRDAEMTAESGNRDWPNSAPYRAVQLCEFEAHPQATEPAPSTAGKLTLEQITRIYDRYGGDMVNCTRAIERELAAARSQPTTEESSVVAGEKPVLEPLTDSWILERCAQSWVFETAKQWVRMTEAAHGKKVPHRQYVNTTGGNQ